MDLRRLEYFVAVAEHGTMTRAAAASFVSQPALSKAIRELEAELKTPLFHRIGRRVTLTPAGEALIDHARQVLRDVRAGAEAVAAVVSLDAGHLDLACLPTLAAQPTADLIGRFRAEHPRVSVRLAAPEDPADVASMVRNGSIELGINDSIGAEDLVAVPLTTEELVFILPPGPEGAVVRSLRDLASLPLVVTPPNTSTRRKLDEAFGTAAHRLWIAVETAQRDAIVPLVLAGAGAALVPVGTAETAQRLGASIVRPRRAINRDIVCLHRAAALSPVAARFLADATTESGSVHPPRSR
jgi:DNA-binding transcriptional LysR family regulator